MPKPIVKDRHVSGEIRDNTPYADRPVLQPRHKKPVARALRTAGWSFKRIAAHLEISHSSAYLFACDIQIPYKPPAHYDIVKVLQRKQRKAEAIAMRREGKTLQEITNILGFSDGYVSKLCEGLPNPKSEKNAEKKRIAREMRKRGDTLKAIAAQLNVAFQTISEWTRDPSRKRQPIDPAVPSKMLEMRRDGARLAEIADAFGVSKSWVSRVLIDLWKSSISGETLYYYRRDANGMVTEMERHKVAPSGEVVIEKVRM